MKLFDINMACFFDVMRYKNMFAFTHLIFDYADMIVKDNCIQANAELLENSEKFLQILFLR